MIARRLHRFIGIVMLLPFFGWALTGLIFFIKPGYTGAYEVLVPKTYPVETPVQIATEAGWQEFRFVKTILGDHLLVKGPSGWTQVDPANHQPRTVPSENEIRTLVKDAFSSNPSRYGEIASVSGNTVKTNTGIEVTLDWNRLSLQQKGTDTDWIDLLYKIHYLQWTGIKRVDQVVGLMGITLVLVLSCLGAWLAFKKGQRDEEHDCSDMRPHLLYNTRQCSSCKVVSS